MARTLETELVESIPTESPLRGAIVVATDGTHDSDGAVRLGVALAARDRVEAAFLSVVEPLAFTEDGTALLDAESLTRLAIEERDGELTAQRTRTWPDRVAWPCAIHVGNRVDEIVAHAQHHGASLITLGLGSHGVVARLLHRETALRVIRAASTPVLAVPGDVTELPRSAIA